MRRLPLGTRITPNATRSVPLYRRVDVEMMGLPAAELRELVAVMAASARDTSPAPAEALASERERMAAEEQQRKVSAARLANTQPRPKAPRI